jgi:hypothetical protein
MISSMTLDDYENLLNSEQMFDNIVIVFGAGFCYVVHIMCIV